MWPPKTVGNLKRSHTHFLLGTGRTQKKKINGFLIFWCLIASVQKKKMNVVLVSALLGGVLG
jgi:hypothetical protein